MNTVKTEMGDIQLQFIWMSTDRTLYKYANAIQSFKTHSKWKKFHKQMGKGNFFAVLTTTKDAPESKSGYSYDILGVLCTFADEHELREANAMYWNALQGESQSFSKLLTTMQVAGGIRNWFAESDCMDDFNINTYLLLELCTEGGLKQARRISKEFV